MAVSKNFPRSACMYSIKDGFTFDVEAMQEQLASFAFAPCSPESSGRLGFVPPIGHEFVHRLVDGAFTLSLKWQKKIIPTPEVDRLLKEKTDGIFEREQRLVRKNEKAQFRVEIITELCRVALSKYSEFNVLVIPKSRLLCVLGASLETADYLTSFLRKAIGSLPIIPLQLNKLDLSAFFLGAIHSHRLRIQDKLIVEKAGGKATFKSCEWDYGVTEMIKEGFSVNALDVDFDEILIFSINDKGVLSSFRWSESLRLKSELEFDSGDQSDADARAVREEQAKRLKSADYILIQGVFSSLVESLAELFGGIELAISENKKEKEEEAK